MTHLAISDELANTISAAAAHHGRTPEDLLKWMFERLEAEAAVVESVVTPELKNRILKDLERADRGEFITSEEVDRNFQALFTELEARG